jgi:hypothetical protein
MADKVEMPAAVGNVVPKVDEKEILGIDEMLSAKDVEYAEVLAWNGKYVRIGSLTAEDIIDWREESDGPAKRTMGIRLFVNSLVDKDGNRIGTQKHYEAFKKKSNAVMERVLTEIVKLNGLSTKAEDATKKG